MMDDKDSENSRMYVAIRNKKTILTAQVGSHKRSLWALVMQQVELCGVAPAG